MCVFVIYPNCGPSDEHPPEIFSVSRNLFSQLSSLSFQRHLAQLYDNEG